MDASDYGAEAVLLQEDEHGVEQPLCHFLKKCTIHQTQYGTFAKEAFSLLLALQHLEVYIGQGARHFLLGWGVLQLNWTWLDGDLQFRI